jgi:hypothetical protein
VTDFDASDVTYTGHVFQSHSTFKGRVNQSHSTFKRPNQDKSHIKCLSLRGDMLVNRYDIRGTVIKEIDGDGSLAINPSCFYILSAKFNHAEDRELLLWRDSDRWKEIFQ